MIVRRRWMRSVAVTVAAGLLALGAGCSSSNPTAPVDGNEIVSDGMVLVGPEDCYVIQTAHGTYRPAGNVLPKSVQANGMPVHFTAIPTAAPEAAICYADSNWVQLISIEPRF